MRELMPWLLVCGNCVVFPLGMFSLGMWVRGRQIRVRSPFYSASRVEDKTGPTAKKSVLSSVQQRRDETVGYGPK